MVKQQPVFDQQLFNQQLANGETSVQVYRKTLRDAHQTIEDRFMQGHQAAELVHVRADLIDQVLTMAWKEYFPDTKHSIALVAVGGYGRSELHPGSDIDILILLADDMHEHYRVALEKFIMFLWDIGLEVGQSVRSIQECVIAASEDICTATNLMEARHLAGSVQLYEQMRLETGPEKLWYDRDFFEAKLQEQENRHHKYNDSAYNLEPNIKEGPGGLRDIQMIGWVAKRHFNAETLYDLVKHKFLTEEEHFQLVEGQNFLWQVRFALHIITRRHEDRLLFDYQRNLAEIFGYRDGNNNLAVEQFMRSYYRTIRELSLLNEMLLQLFQEAILYADEHGKPVPINKRFQISKGFIEARHHYTFKHYPFALLEMFLLIQQHPEIKGVRASTIRLIRNYRHLINDEFRADLANRSLFMEIMRQPRGITHELRRMNRYDVLANYIPAFGKIVGLMQYDLFHIYTVDEHILVVVRNIRRMMLDAHAHELPFCSKLIKKIPKPELLYLAGIFHDIAKGREGDHSELGEQEAIDFCQLHKLNKYDTNIVAWLVNKHLLMSSTAQRKDISDPEVIAEFASIVGNAMRLDYLFLFTIADMRGTNNTICNSWKASLLQELYSATQRAFRRGLENPLAQAELRESSQQQALDILTQQNIDSDAIHELWDSLNDEYFIRHTADEIVWHTEAIITNHKHIYPLILVQQHGQRGGTEIFIYTPIASHLFAASTGTFDRLGLNVADARIFTSDKGYAFDTYVLIEEDGEAINNHHRVEEILDELRHDLLPVNFNSKKINRRSARQLQHFDTATTITFRQDDSNQRTVMELITADRPGLLLKIGLAFMKFNLQLQNAKITTIGERVEDVFFFSDSGLQQVNDAALLEKLRHHIITTLDN